MGGKKLAMAAVVLLAGACVVYGGMRAYGASADRGKDRHAATDAGPVPVAQSILRVRAPLSVDDPRMPVQLSQGMLRDALRKGELTIELDDGTRYPVRMLRGQDEPNGRWTVVGRVQTRVGPQSAVLTFGTDAVFGVIPKPDGYLLHVTTTRGLAYIGPAGGMVPDVAGGGPDRPMDVLVPPPPAAGTRATAAARRPSDPMVVAPATSSPSRMAVAGESTPVQIDLLVLYDSALVELRGSVSAAETEVTNLVAVANQAHLDSGSRVRLSLAGMRQITLPVGSFNQDALNAVTHDQVDGIGIAALRDVLSADLVAVVRPHAEGDPTCGIAWLGAAYLDRQYVDPRWGYSVSAVGSECGPYVFPHEVAHNMGSNHDRDSAGTDFDHILVYGAFPYSFGYRQDGPPSFATIMAYANGRPWIGSFSSPASTACGAACGIEERADNVRSLNQMAPVIAGFRGLAGTVSVFDADGMEPSAGQWSQVLAVVRYSGPIPAGGVHLQLARVGGTATPGLDFEFQSPYPVDIEEGSTDAIVPIMVAGDDAEEGDETILLQLQSVTGAAVARGSAVVSIVDDDPRPVLSGHVRFPDGMVAPSSAFSIQVRGADGDTHATTSILVSPPEFRYAIPFVKNSDIALDAFPPAPFAAGKLELGQLTGSVGIDYDVVAGSTVTGKVVLPPGGIVPAFPLTLDFVETIVGGAGGSYSRPTRHVVLESPSASYSEQVLPGARFSIHLDPGAPYEPFIALGRASGNMVRDITLSTLPSLVVDGIYDLPSEGPNHTSVWLMLSAPAPEGGVTLDYRTEPGTATPGMDYAPVSGTLAFAPGETSKWIEIDTYDDAAVEGDEYFDMVIGNVVGAVATTARASILIPDDDVPAPVLSIRGDSPASEGAEGTRNSIGILAELSAPAPAGGVTASWHTRDGSAIAGQDYAAGSGSLAFAAGQAQAWITLETFGDSAVEEDEYFDVVVDGIAGAVGGNVSLRINLLNDDAASGSGGAPDPPEDPPPGNPSPGNPAPEDHGSGGSHCLSKDGSRSGTRGARTCR